MLTDLVYPVPPAGREDAARSDSERVGRRSRRGSGGSSVGGGWVVLNVTVTEFSEVNATFHVQ
jgi:hypothetical protein